MTGGYSADRRHFLKLMVSLPVALTVGCEEDFLGTSVKKAILSPEESLRKLVLLTGPWPASHREQAEDFVRRFLRYASGAYLPGSGGLLQSLASRLPDAMSTKSINLGVLPEEERKLLVQLVSRLYSFIEVRFTTAGEPPWGECQADRLRHTKAPV
jgi:hypothetical protein